MKYMVLLQLDIDKKEQISDANICSSSELKIFSIQAHSNILGNQPILSNGSSDYTKKQGTNDEYIIIIITIIL